MIFEFLFWSLLFFIIMIIFLSLSLSSFRGSSKIFKESLATYECGFDSFTSSLGGFCVQFFNIAILYLLIDLEITIILPFFLKIMLLSSEFFSFILKMLGLFIILLLLLVIEYKMGGLSCWEEVFF